MTKRKPKPGRPDEGRERLTIHVLPKTAEAIRRNVLTENDTLGKVIDRWAQDPRKQTTGIEHVPIGPNGYGR